MPNRHPYLVAAASLGALALLLAGGRSTDLIVLVGELTLIVLMSAVVVFRVLRRRHGQTGGYGQDAVMPEKIRRWALDEHDGPRPDQRARRTSLERSGTAPTPTFITLIR